MVFIINPTVMEVNGNSESNARSKYVFVFAKRAIFVQVCYIFQKFG